VWSIHLAYQVGLAAQKAIVTGHAKYGNFLFGMITGNRQQTEYMLMLLTKNQYKLICVNRDIASDEFDWEYEKILQNILQLRRGYRLHLSGITEEQTRIPPPSRTSQLNIGSKSVEIEKSSVGVQNNQRIDVKPEAKILQLPDINDHMDSPDNVPITASPVKLTTAGQPMTISTEKSAPKTSPTNKADEIQKDTQINPLANTLNPTARDDQAKQNDKIKTDPVTEMASTQPESDGDEVWVADATTAKEQRRPVVHHNYPTGQVSSSKTAEAVDRASSGYRPALKYRSHIAKSKVDSGSFEAQQYAAWAAPPVPNPPVNQIVNIIPVSKVKSTPRNANIAAPRKKGQPDLAEIEFSRWQGGKV